jgi:hypothetical protein
MVIADFFIAGVVATGDKLYRRSMNIRDKKKFIAVSNAAGGTP